MIRQCKESERESDNGAEIFPQNKVEGKWNAWKDTRDQNVVRDGRNGAGLMCVWIIEMDDSARKLGVEFDSTKAKLGLGACVWWNIEKDNSDHQSEVPALDWRRGSSVN